MALRTCHAFYTTYPQIQQALPVKFKDDEQFEDSTGSVCQIR